VPEAGDAASLITIVEDDQPFRESMRKLVSSLGYTAETFPSAADFLASHLLTATACLVTDVQMPGMTGPELHSHLVAAGYTIPTILVTAYPDEVVRRRALRMESFVTSASRWMTIISSVVFVVLSDPVVRLKRVHEPSCAAGRVN
jgi:CheY-like chemotaxis protein